jgi:hypothetical protein
MTDDEVVDAFVAYLRDNGHPGLKVDRRPDKEVRSEPAIDAIAGPFAIEHTSIDTARDQRRDDSWFMQAVGSLEKELLKAPYRLMVTIAYDAVGKGQDFAAIRAALKRWVTIGAPALPDGAHAIDGAPGIPFRLRVVKAGDRRPGVFFARGFPEDDSLAERVRTAFDRKSAKLAKHHGSSTTILLVENGDIALMNRGILVEAIREAYPSGPPGAVDQVWYADTAIQHELEFWDLTAFVR